jgi:CheY-like chemotaxis protein
VASPAAKGIPFRNCRRPGVNISNLVVRNQVDIARSGDGQHQQRAFELECNDDGEDRAEYGLEHTIIRRILERIRSTPAWCSGVIILATILVVEDDILLSLDTSDALKDAGYDVIAAANADEAIKVLETRNDIRTIFTDINMPGSMDGLKLAAAVRDRWPPVHIIVTSGMRAPHRDEMPANSAFIAKPYRSAEVLEAVCSFE